MYLPGEGAGHGDGVAGAGVHGVVPGHHAVLLRHRVSVLWIKIDNAHLYITEVQCIYKPDL